MPDTVPVFAPDGSLGDIPSEQLAAAVKSGFKPGVNVVSSDGRKGVIPADRTLEATGSGAMRVAPFEDQGIQHPGFWAGLGEDLKSMVSPLAIAKGTVSTIPGVGSLMKAVDEYHSYRTTGKTSEQAHNEQQQSANYPGWYRYLAAPVAEGVGVNVSGMEQSAKTGDVGGVAGHAAAVPAVMAASDLAARALPTAVRAAQSPTMAKVGTTAATVGKAALDLADTATFNRLSAGAKRIVQGARDVSDIWKADPATFPGAPLPEHPGIFPGAPYPEHPGVFPGAPLPETPAPEQLNPSLVSPSRTLPGQISKEVIGAHPIPPRQGLMLPGEVESEATSPKSTPPTALRGNNPDSRVFSGESALRQLLTGQDNGNLMKIAKSRGINVTQESQLRPGLADGRLITKIIDDFSTDELAEMRDKYMETERFKHNFGDIGPEAWKTLSLQNYFPDVKIAQAVAKRSQAAIANAAPKPPVAQTANDLTEILQKSVAAAKAAKGAQ